MKKITLLTDRVDFEKDIEALRDDWLREIFLFIGFDLDELDSMPKDKVLDFFIKNKLELIFYVEMQALKVKYEDEIIAEWGGPEIELISENNHLCNKINIHYWSIIDQQLYTEEDL